MELSVIIPTYNEKDSLQILIEKIFSIFSGVNGNKINGEIVIIDDNSPDGTGLLAEKLNKEYKNIKVIHREKKLGLSSAVLNGVKVADGRVLGIMDADLSHPPEAISPMFERIKNENIDFVIGSRYIKGGEISGWSFYRRFVSRGATVLAKMFTKVKDPMSGFFLIKKECVDGIKFNPKGFKICLEFLVKANYYRLVEYPIIFTNRTKGKSKATLRVYCNYLIHLLNLFFYRYLRRKNVK